MRMIVGYLRAIRIVCLAVEFLSAAGLGWLALKVIGVL